MTDHRRYTRLPFTAEVTLTRPEGRGQRAALLDISLNGAMLEAPTGFSGTVGESVSLSIQVTGAPVCIEMEGHVAHLAEGRVGVRCTSIDLDSLSHLRRLLELNLGDPNLLERELFPDR